jgi:hypothetical protein
MRLFANDLRSFPTSTRAARARVMGSYRLCPFMSEVRTCASWTFSSPSSGADPMEKAEPMDSSAAWTVLRNSNFATCTRAAHGRAGQERHLLRSTRAACHEVF